MKCFIVTYSHKHGIDTWPVFADEAPTLETIAEGLSNYGPDREDEALEISSAFDIPKPAVLVSVSGGEASIAHDPGIAAAIIDTDGIADGDELTQLPINAGFEELVEQLGLVAGEDFDWQPPT